MEIKWKAIYSDGKSLNQYNEDGSVNKYIDIDRSILDSFELYKDGVLFFTLKLEKNQRLIFRRRVSLSIEGKIKEVIYLVGWQRIVGNENVQSISYIFEDGRIVMAGQWNEKSSYAYSVNLIEEEKWQ